MYKSNHLFCKQTVFTERTAKWITYAEHQSLVYGIHSLKH